MLEIEDNFGKFIYDFDYTISMAETSFQDNLMQEIGEIKKVVLGMKSELDFLKDKFEDKFLSEEDKKALDETLEAEKNGELKTMKEVFG